MADVSETTDWLRVDDPEELEISEVLRAGSKNDYYHVDIMFRESLHSELELMILGTAWRGSTSTEPAVVESSLIMSLGGPEVANTPIATRL